MDLWIDGRLGAAAVQVNAFARRMDDYITIAPTTLPRAQPGSPPPVLQSINGEARYYGGEVQLTYVMTPAVTLGASTSYLYGDDRTLAEPALGVTPWRSALVGRFAPLGNRWFVQGQMTVAGAQRRVATTRGERATSGWTTLDLQSGYRIARRIEIRAAVRNALNRPYVHHLSALDAFTGGRIAEPGRVGFVRVTVE